MAFRRLHSDPICARVRLSPRCRTRAWKRLGFNPVRRRWLTCPFGAGSRAEEGCMDFEKYTDRAKGFVQAAQGIAQRDGDPQFCPAPRVRRALDDGGGGAVGLVQRAGGGRGGARPAAERARARRPKGWGGGGGQIYLAPELARVFDAAQKIADKAGDKFVTVERLL